MAEQMIEAETAGEAAALWWAKQIGAPVHKIVRDNATGQDRETGDFAFLAMQLVSARHPVTEAMGETFVKVLAPVIDGKLERSEFASLGVDYGPDRDLADAAQAVGIHLSRFPFKTHMWISPDHVTAALGYGSWPTLIWTAPGWQRPMCGQHDWTDDGVRDVICSKPRYHEPDHSDWIPDPARCKRCSGTYSQHTGSQRLDHAWEPRTESDQ